MRPTKNDIDPVIRQNMIDLLTGMLCDAIDLQLQCKQAHWNVKGLNFVGLHELFDSLHEIVEEHVDTMAERIVQLGGFACGTPGEVGSKTQLPAYPPELSNWQDHVSHLSDSFAAFAKRTRAAITVSDDADFGTADIFIQLSRAVDKGLWFIESNATAQQISIK